MDTPTFLAWSLLLAGLSAAFFVAVRRVAVAKGAPPLALPVAQRVGMVVMPLLLGTMATKLGCDLRDVALPGWTHLVFGTTVLTMGLFYRTSSKVDGTGFASPQVLAYMLMVTGVVILILEGYHYAISLGTAASFSLP